ncbi:MAG: hypothetical protein DA408_14910 [Bacteroidetes bacterium]|nr:MAG: hypothetical protein C7N36_01335 [Bacteroidota bacterium]PTM10914.1 MAG: hypothetical protein DA408_14910 [Bacteroidota bacterium]
MYKALRSFLLMSYSFSATQPLKAPFHWSYVDQNRKVTQKALIQSPPPGRKGFLFAKKKGSQHPAGAVILFFKGKKV